MVGSALLVVRAPNRILTVVLLQDSRVAVKISDHTTSTLFPCFR